MLLFYQYELKEDYWAMNSYHRYIRNTSTYKIMNHAIKVRIVGHENGRGERCCLPDNSVLYFFSEVETFVPNPTKIQEPEHYNIVIENPRYCSSSTLFYNFPFIT